MLIILSILFKIITLNLRFYQYYRGNEKANVVRKGRDSGERFQTLDNYTERNIYSVYHNEHKWGQLQNTNSSGKNMGCKGFHS